MQSPATEIVNYQIGLPESLRDQAALLYDDAFSRKLRFALPDDEKRVLVLARSFEPGHCVVAIRGDDLLGVAGFHDRDGSFTDHMTIRTLRSTIGIRGTMRALPLLALLASEPKAGQLHLEGIAVSNQARGLGIGSRLIAMLEERARSEGFTGLTLEVVDTNPDARRLYERLGFVEVDTIHLPFLERLMGFRASTSMLKRLE